MVTLLTQVNTEYAAQMNDEQKQRVQQLSQALTPGMSIDEINTLVYAIPKDDTLSKEENAPRQKAFFKDIYRLLLNKDRGPRLSTFLWALEAQQVQELLSI